MSNLLNPLNAAFSAVEDLTKSVGHIGERLLDRQLKLAVTGLRRSGKTVFTTAMIHQLLAGHDLDFLTVSHEKRLLGVRIKRGSRSPFPFQTFETALLSDPPQWPEPTETLTELRLEIRYRTTGWIGSMVSPDTSFDIDIVDYPGEWLLDLPLLQQDFAHFSQQSLAMASSGIRQTYAQKFKDALPDASLPSLLQSFRDYLTACQDEAKLSFIQPGRLVHGFDELAENHAFCPLPPGHPLQTEMTNRYNRYVDELVRPFYKDHFSNFDRQVVLVDLLSSLNAGPEHFADTQLALASILKSFAYGQNSWFRHLFAPRVEKVLFAASKADHVAANQHANLKQLLQLMVEPALKRAKLVDIKHDVIALASLRSTDTVKTEHNGQTLSCVRGRLKHEPRETILFPGEIPSELPAKADWESGIFRFYDFAPRPLRQGLSGQHIRLDQAIEFLVGDKLI